MHKGTLSLHGLFLEENLILWPPVAAALAQHADAKGRVDDLVLVDAWK
jgi:hypothetical protein